jgi:hypothetical protein
MEKAEASGIVMMLLSTLRLRHPIPDREAMLDGWHLALADVPYEAGRAAAGWWMGHEQFVPEPSEIRRRALGMLTQLPEPYEAWAKVLDDLDHRRRTGEWPEAAAARAYKTQYGRWPEAAESAIDQAVQALGGWEELKGDHWERKEFLIAYQEFARKAMDAAAIDEPALAVSAGPALRAIAGGR